MERIEGQKQKHRDTHINSRLRAPFYWSQCPELYLWGGIAERGHSFALFCFLGIANG